MYTQKEKKRDKSPLWRACMSTPRVISNALIKQSNSAYGTSTRNVRVDEYAPPSAIARTAKPRRNPSPPLMY